MTDTTNDVALGEVQATAPNVDNGGLPAGLPMPRDPDLLTDLDRRYRPSTFGPDRYPFPIPNGWFVVAEASEIGPGEVRALHAFDRDLVLYRAADGTPHVLDAHCPHLGAHLAVGGRVEEGCLRCPFHGWKCDGESGTCVDIPYGDVKRIPPKAHARTYPTLERNHMIWAWYHAQDGEPFYDVPEVPEFHDPDWSPIIVRTLRDPRVGAGHGREQRRLLALPLRARVRRDPRGRVHHRGHLQEDDRRRRRRSSARASGSAWACCACRATSRSCPRRPRSTPATCSCGGSSPRRARSGRALPSRRPSRFCAGVSQDIPIWENKVYRDPPVITKTEKLILEHRRWCEQFYS